MYQICSVCLLGGQLSLFYTNQELVTPRTICSFTFQLWLSSDSAILFPAAVPSIAQCLAMGRHSSHWWMSLLTLSYFEHGNQSAHYFPRLLLLQPQALNHGICLRHIGTTFPRIIKLTSYNLLWSDGMYQSSVFLTKTASVSESFSAQGFK